MVIATAGLAAGVDPAVATWPWARNERSAVAGLKTTSYAENVVALGRAHARGASEALFANTVGELCEGAGSNVFVRAGRPARHSAALVGLPGRRHPRRCCSKLGDGAEADVPIEALAEHERGVPHVVDVATSSPSPRSTAGPSPRPGPLTAGGRGSAFADLLAARRPRPLTPIGPEVGSVGRTQVHHVARRHLDR